jgi:hypothetical protein
LTTFSFEGDFGKWRAVSVNVHNGFGGFVEIAFLAGAKKTFFVIAQTPSFSAKRTGKTSLFGSAGKSASGPTGTELGQKFAENGAILKISGRTGRVRRSWRQVRTGKMRSPEEK